VRLEEDAHRCAWISLPHCSEGAGHLGRMMAVVVHHRQAAHVVHLEPAAGTGEAREHGRSLGAFDARRLERGERGAGVQPVELARQSELAAVGRRVTDDRARLRQPALERALELAERPVLGVVVELDVRHHGDRSGQREDGAVGLVALDDEEPVAEARVRAELWDGGADQPRRVAPGLPEDEGDHARGRPLSVGARHHDRVAARDELAQELGAPQPRHVRVGGRDDRLPAVADHRLRRDLNVHS
jgi:hypothetical protein